MNALLRARTMLAAVAVTAALPLSGLALSGPARASGPIVYVTSTGQGPSAAVERSANWMRVRVVTKVDPRALVKATAWSALISPNVDAAITRFFVKDQVYAQQLAVQAKARNADFTARVLNTHTAEFAPEVHAAAQYAISGNDTDRELFARTGYAAAKERDRQARDASGVQAAALVQADRDFVARLRDTDPGQQVRAAAAFAVRPAATDADLIEFFTFGWVSAAGLDLDAFVIQCTDEDVRWRATMLQLFADAQAAEQAARAAAGEAAVQARAAAARAWAAAGEQTGPARVAWARAQEVAEAQAANWQRIAQAAGAETSQNWQAIAGSAGTTAEQWTTARDDAAAQAAYWNARYAQALAAEQVMQTTPTG